MRKNCHVMIECVFPPNYHILSVSGCCRLKRTNIDFESTGSSCLPPKLKNKPSRGCWNHHRPLTLHWHTSHEQNDTSAQVSGVSSEEHSSAARRNRKTCSSNRRMCPSEQTPVSIFITVQQVMCGMSHPRRRISDWCLKHQEGNVWGGCQVCWWRSNQQQQHTAQNRLG